MFGYISPDAPYLFKKDERLYNALYCGICKSIGAECGLLARTALTYDSAFLSALLHNIRGEDVKITEKRCVLHVIRKRPVVETDGLSRAIGAVNTALAYFKLCDDKSDGEARGALRHLYKRGYRRVLKKYPKLAGIISGFYEKQRTLERDGCAVIDMAAEPTAEMMRAVSRGLLEEFATEHTDALFYAVGKWVYLIDALDDYDKDVKKSRFNVLYNVYGERTRAEAVKKGEDELKFVFNELFAEMRQSLANIKFHFNHDLTDNIILRGIPLRTRALFYGADGANGAKEKYEQEKS